MKHRIELIESVDGKLSIYLNDFRITPRSTKPLGYGKVIKKWIIDENDIIQGIENHGTL